MHVAAALSAQRFPFGPFPWETFPIWVTSCPGNRRRVALAVLINQKSSNALEHIPLGQCWCRDRANPQRICTMSGNTDKAAGMANEAAGKVKQGIGKAVGSEKLQGEGAAQEVKGDAQQLKGDAKNAVKDGVNKVADEANKKL
jgi:uncharacterized protein YjbJ (UPF0337 family)